MTTSATYAINSIPRDIEMVVYCVRNKMTGALYIGITTRTLSKKQISILKQAGAALALKRRRKVICVETRETFPSCLEAAVAYGLKYHSVLCVSAGRRASVYGKSFRYLEN